MFFKVHRHLSELAGALDRAGSVFLDGADPWGGTVMQGLTLFDHRAATVHFSLGAPPPAEIVVVDPGGQIDTEAFHAHDRRTALTRLAEPQREAFELLQTGVARCDLGHWRRGHAQRSRPSGAVARQLA